MAKRIICAITALIFITSMLVFPASAETTENGYEIPELCLRTDEPNVTNYCFELKRVHPGYVKKDGVIGENEYFHLDIPRDEIILKGSNTVTGDAKTRSEAMKASIEAYVSWDYVHGVNVALQYTSPEPPVQTYSSLYYDGRITPLPGSTKDNPLYNDSFNDDGSFKAITEDFWGQTGFTIQTNDKNGRCFYYGIGRNTETGEYLMGHYYFSDLSGQGYGQYGYDPTYIPFDGEDFCITYGPGNLVTMEWSVPFTTILGHDPVDGEKIGLSMTATQGTNSSPDPDKPWAGDLENNAAVLLGNTSGFQSLATEPIRTKDDIDPVTGKACGKVAGNLPMVAFFNTAEPTTPEVPLEEPTYSASLTLKDSVDINLYVDSANVDMSNYSVVYSLDDEGETFSAPQYFDSDHIAPDGRYAFTTASLNANQLSRPVTIKILRGDRVRKTIKYSVKDYCDTICATGSTAEQGLKDLCSALMAYGHCARKAFPETASSVDIPKTGYVSAAYNKTSRKISASGWNNIPAGKATLKNSAATGASASLALKSQTELSLYVSGVGSLNNVTVTVNGEPWNNFVIKESASKCRVIVKGLRPVDLKKTVVMDCDEANITYSPMTFVKSQDSGTADLVRTLRALYYYSTAAISYFGAN